MLPKAGSGLSPKSVPSPNVGASRVGGSLAGLGSEKSGSENVAGDAIASEAGVFPEAEPSEPGDGSEKSEGSKLEGESESKLVAAGKISAGGGSKGSGACCSIADGTIGAEIESPDSSSKLVTAQPPVSGGKGSGSLAGGAGSDAAGGSGAASGGVGSEAGRKTGTSRLVVSSIGSNVVGSAGGGGD